MIRTCVFNLEKSPSCSCLFCLAFSILFFCGSSSTAQNVVPDQAFTPGNTFSVSAIFDSVDRAQILQPNIAGTLDHIDVHVNRQSNSGSNPALRWDIREITASGLPSELNNGPEVLASGLIAAFDIPLVTVFDTLNRPAPVEIDLTPFNIAVSPGDNLALVLQAPNFGTSLAWHRSQLNGPTDFVRNPGGAGNFWVVDTFSERALGFETFIDTTPSVIPEPSSLVFLAFTASLLRLRRERT